MKNGKKIRFFVLSYDRFCCQCFGNVVFVFWDIFFGFFGKKKKKMRNFLIRVFVSPSFFCEILSFWVIVDFVFFSGKQRVAQKNLVGFIARHAVYTNLIRLVSSILKHARFRSAAPVGNKIKKSFQISVKSWLH